MRSRDFSSSRPPQLTSSAVHITSGTASLAWSIYLGKRRGYGTSKLAYRPHSVSHIILGTCLIWFGWFGFNGGSELAANLRSVQAMIVTNLAAAMGGLTWMFMDSFYTGFVSFPSLARRRKLTSFFRSQKVLGRLFVLWNSRWSRRHHSRCRRTLSPSLSLVPPLTSRAVRRSPRCPRFRVRSLAPLRRSSTNDRVHSLLGSIACNYATSLKIIFGYDDAVDGFALHGIGGLVGSLLTGLLADSRVTGFDGYSAGGGWVRRGLPRLHWDRD